GGRVPEGKRPTSGQREEAAQGVSGASPRNDVAGGPQMAQMTCPPTADDAMRQAGADPWTVRAATNLRHPMPIQGRRGRHVRKMRCGLAFPYAGPTAGRAPSRFPLVKEKPLRNCWPCRTLYVAATRP